MFKKLTRLPQAKPLRASRPCARLQTARCSLGVAAAPAAARPPGLMRDGAPMLALRIGSALDGPRPSCKSLGAERAPWRAGQAARLYLWLCAGGVSVYKGNVFRRAELAQRPEQKVSAMNAEAIVSYSYGPEQSRQRQYMSLIAGIAALLRSRCP